MSENDMEGRAENPPKYPYTKTSTIINNLSEQRQIAWIDGAIWLPVGSVIELGPPNRDAVVIGSRLHLGPGDSALIVVDVEDPGGEEFVPRHVAERIIQEDQHDT